MHRVLRLHLQRQTPNRARTDLEHKRVSTPENRSLVYGWTDDQVIANSQVNKTPLKYQISDLHNLLLANLCSVSKTLILSLYFN